MYEPIQIIIVAPDGNGNVTMDVETYAKIINDFAEKAHAQGVKEGKRQMWKALFDTLNDESPL